MHEKLFIALQHIAPQRLISRLAGYLANSKTPWIKDTFIARFKESYGVNLEEALIQDPKAYENFNAFFTRKLRPEARPIATGANQIACPVDGSVSQCGAILEHQMIQAKGFNYSVQSLLGGDAEIAKPFQNGHFATLYLAPKDYHRIHSPYAGSLRKMIYIPGKLFSVNTVTANHVPALFARNERVVCLFDTEIGHMAVVLVGAMIVASIHTSWAGLCAPKRPRTIQTTDYNQPLPLAKGEEIGYFSLGSTAIVLFENANLAWNADMLPHKIIRMGEEIGRLRSS